MPSGPDVPLPTEFILLEFGVMQTSKGPVPFDAEAAARVMAAYTREGVDFMIDLEHDSLRAPIRPDSKDARGWAKLEVRSDGLWAVDVKWTPDGERRLREKTQRYISPAFLEDEAGRVVKMVNCAICARPATYDAPALVAASKDDTRDALARNARAATLSKQMDPKDVQAAIDALKNNDPAAALALLEKILVSAAGGMPAEDGAPPPDATAGSADPAAPVAMAKALCAELKARLLADAGHLSQLCKTLGKATIAEAFEDVGALVTMRAERVTSEKASEDAQRAELVGELVKLGAELPATAWADPEKRIPVKRLAAESVPDLTTRVKALRASKGAPPPAVRAPAEASDLDAKIKALSKETLAEIAKAKITPAEFIERREERVRRIA